MSTRVKLSNNFYLDEFTNIPYEQLTKIQGFMLQNICEFILEPLRTFAGKATKKPVSFKITSGIRSSSDRERLINQGYHPSETSDHDYGQMVKLTNKSKIAKYGEYYSYSVGAADIVPSCGAKELFTLCKPYFNRIENTIDLPEGKIALGQCILEKGNGYWIHVSNPPKLFFNSPILQTLKKTCFLISEDNGITYQPA